jgi:hypothetical protein
MFNNKVIHIFQVWIRTILILFLDKYGYVTCLMHIEAQDPSLLQKNCVWKFHKLC